MYVRIPFNKKTVWSTNGTVLYRMTTEWFMRLGRRYLLIYVKKLTSWEVHTPRDFIVDKRSSGWPLDSKINVHSFKKRTNIVKKYQNLLFHDWSRGGLLSPWVFAVSFFVVLILFHVNFYFFLFISFPVLFDYVLFMFCFICCLFWSFCFSLVFLFFFLICFLFFGLIVDKMFLF